MDSTDFLTYILALEAVRVPLTLGMVALLLLLDLRDRVRPQPQRPAHPHLPGSFTHFSHTIWFILLCLVWGWIPCNSWAPGLYTGAWLLSLSLAVVLWSRLTLGDNFTRCDVARLPTQIVRHGPYRWVRHPIYGGYLLHWLSLCLVFPSFPVAALALVMARLYPSVAALEERSLADQFPDYENYSRQTHRFWPIWLRLGLAVVGLGLGLGYFIRPPEYSWYLAERLPRALPGGLLDQVEEKQLLRFWILNSGPLTPWTSGPVEALRLDGAALKELSAGVAGLAPGEHSLQWGGTGTVRWEPPARARAEGRTLHLPPGGVLEFSVEAHQGARLLWSAPASARIRWENGGLPSRADASWECLASPREQWLDLPGCPEPSLLRLTAVEGEAVLQDARLCFWNPPPRVPTGSSPTPASAVPILLVFEPEGPLPDPWQQESARLSHPVPQSDVLVTALASLLTSQPPRIHHLLDPDDGLDPALWNLPQALRRVGYRCQQEGVPPPLASLFEASPAREGPLFLCLVRPSAERLQEVLRQWTPGGLVMVTSCVPERPWWVRFPQARWKGYQVDQPWQHLDLAPLILDTLGLPVPGSLRGHAGELLADRQQDPILARFGGRDVVQVSNWMMVVGTQDHPPVRLHARAGIGWDTTVNQVFRYPAVRAHLWSLLQEGVVEP